ncbi:MAG: UbiA family prenyltransferase [Bacteroidales bacterium]|nr:MAG: UbiA family prenyltransferase [Bacteroidales bacterium]
MKQATSYYPVYSFRFFRALFIHMRPYLLFVSGVAGLSGMAVAERVNIPAGIFIMAFIPLFLGYGFGQALTDCFQIDTDSISSPYRPLVKGEVSPRAVGIVSSLGLVIISVLIIYLNPYNATWCIMSIIGLITYTYFKKNFWFAGPFYNGWIVMLLPVIGFMAVSGGGFSMLKNADLWNLCGLSLFSYTNFVLIGYLKDITADKETGYKTFPVVFGWNKTLYAGDIFVILGVFFCYRLIGHNDPAAFVLFLIASVAAISGQAAGHFTQNKVESNAYYPVISTVRAFILWHLSVALHFRPQWLVFIIIFYLAFEAVLYLRPSKEQI